ncbi:hypothetical protein SOVF_046570 [Spinacia oleracea]|uniref:Cotton fiber protein n=1 Tax=Spinacia oleracea TaxID=3562 RepID=A0A9R0IGF5_SPIOL|nr:uncharacterized protein LOC110787353 [Spinacia oleracea]KNA21072.1 hypothetical protein SOVF_046570 [Spinacia oleracea]
MSCFYLPKKLKQLPSSSKKAWNSFKSSLSPKLRNFRDTSRSLSTLPRSVTRTASLLFDLRPQKRRRSIPTPQPARATRGVSRDFYYFNQYNYQHLEPYTSGPNSPATVYVDRLFGESLSSSTTTKEAGVGVTIMEAASTSNNNTIREEGRGGGGGGGAKKRKKVKNNNNNWKEVVSSMPNIRGTVDERAEEFISRFRQEMQIQREQSLIEFQEMLARSA